MLVASPELHQKSTRAVTMFRARPAEISHLTKCGSVLARERAEDSARIFRDKDYRTVAHRDEIIGQDVSRPSRVSARSADADKKSPASSRASRRSAAEGGSAARLLGGSADRAV
jgi:hypothetical protein